MANGLVGWSGQKGQNWKVGDKKSREELYGWTYRSGHCV